MISTMIMLAASYKHSVHLLTMKEIVKVYTGDVAVRMGCQYWGLVARDHGVNSDTGFYDCGSSGQVDKMPVVFRQDMAGRYHGRAVMIADDDIRNSCDKFGILSDNWETPGDSVLEAVRTELELCDTCQGVQLCSSLREQSLVHHLRDLYPGLVLTSDVVIPKNLTRVANTLAEVIRCSDLVTFFNTTVIRSQLTKVGKSSTIL